MYWICLYRYPRSCRGDDGGPGGGKLHDCIHWHRLQLAQAAMCDHQAGDSWGRSKWWYAGQGWENTSPVCKAVPWQAGRWQHTHKGDHSIDSGWNLQINALRENGPFFYGKFKTQIAGRRAGMEEAKDDRSIKSIAWGED